jgi:hypothetical protein
MFKVIKTPEQIAAEKTEAERARIAAEARRYLAETDWMVIRAIDTGKPVPDDVTEARAKARKQIL